jgi:hypothetical protein
LSPWYKPDVATLRQGVPLLLLLACASPERESADAGQPVARPERKNGKRLQFLRWTSTDGTKGPEILRDTELGIECFWMAVGQDEYRCLPRDRIFYYPVRFRDAACTELVYTFNRVRTCDEPPEYLYAPTASPTCPAAFQLSKRGAELPERAYYHLMSGGGCIKTPVSLAPSETLYDYGERMSTTDFVAGTLRTGAPKNGFALTYMDGEDGSSMHFGFRDVKGDFPCLNTLAADGQQRCLPTPLARADAFTDPGCTAPAAAGVRTSCEPESAFAWRNEPNACGARQTVLRLGGRLQRGYHAFSDGCDTGTTARFLHYFDLGDELDPAGFVPLPASVIDGPKRVRSYTVKTPAGSYTSNLLQDTKLGVDCSIYLLSDGTRRCAPNKLGAELNLFSDALCTMPVAVGDGADCPVGHAYGSVPDSCPQQLRIYELEPRFYEGPVHALVEGTCRDAEVKTGDGIPPVFQPIVREMQPDEFVEFRPPP